MTPEAIPLITSGGLESLVQSCTARGSRPAVAGYPGARGETHSDVTGFFVMITLAFLMGVVARIGIVLLFTNRIARQRWFLWIVLPLIAAPYAARICPVQLSQEWKWA